jgi:hypothetical protein
LGEAYAPHEESAPPANPARLKSIAEILFTLAWCVLAFAVVRALVLLWLRDARIAALAALAVAGAFALGSWSPFVLRGGVAAAPPSPAPNAAGAGTHASGPSGCPPGASPGSATAHGHVDSVTAGGNSSEVHGDVEVSANAPVQFTGWIALPSDVPARAACAVVDGVVAESSGSYGIARPDVAAALKVPAALRTGFTSTVVFAPGTHRLTVAVPGAGESLVTLPAAVVVHAR